jgi:hypothetical protein
MHEESTNGKLVHDCYIYVVVGGSGFDPVSFQDSLPPALQGGWRCINSKTVKGQRSVDGWKSQPVPVETERNIGAAVDDLLNELLPFLRDAKENRNGIISILAVYSYVSEIGPKGIYLEKNTIAAMAELGADFDYDQY